MITVEALTKHYGAYRAVDDISFQVAPGRVTGFLGPNGAGKSTTLRILCGLTEPTTGTATIAGVAYRSLPNPGRRVGTLLDASAQHAGRTGREVLHIAAMTMGLPKRRIDETLETVGLTPEESRRRVRDYSLGMRQRLGLANALLGSPEILILDEPANGLDPAGIRWMRGLLRGHADAGGTVLLSSHLLREIEVIADDLIVIGRGRVVASGAKDELLRAAGTFVRGLDDAGLGAVLGAAGLRASRASDGGWQVDASAEQIGRAAAQAGAVLLELRPADGGGLEEMFLSLTAADAREEVAA